MGIASVLFISCCVTALLLLVFLMKDQSEYAKRQLASEKFRLELEKRKRGMESKTYEYLKKQSPALAKECELGKRSLFDAFSESVSEQQADREREKDMD